MSVRSSGTLNKNLDYIASKGIDTEDIGKDFEPTTTDSMMRAAAESDADSVGEDTNSPAFPNQPETGLPSAEGMQQVGNEGRNRAKSSLK